MSRPKNRELFAPVDAAWLRMDRPTNMMMITGIMMFDKPLDFQRYREIVETRFLVHRRFRQRIRESLVGLPYWEDDPYFDVSSHVHRVALPAPGDVAALQEMTGDLMSTPLDKSRPLWHFHLVDNFNGGCALIGRMHHCLGDGLALMDVLLGMADEKNEAVQPVGSARRPALLDPLVRPGESALSKAIDGIDTVLHEAFEALTRRGHARELLKQGGELANSLAKEGSDYAAALGKLLLTPPDQHTLFKTDCGVTKRAAWSQPFPLEDAKAIGRKLGGTVNDVLLAAVAGALRRYLELRGEATAGVELRAMVPVSIRRAHEMGQLGNRFGLVILTLPVGTVNAVERVQILSQRMADIKRSPEAAVAYGILATMGSTTVDIEKLIVDIFASKVSAVMTNVPGPKQPLYMAGSKMTDLMFWVPQAGALGLGISIMSYAGHVTVGIATDSCIAPDPQTIVAGFHAELSEMRAAAFKEAAAPEAAAIGTETEPIMQVTPVEEPPAAPAIKTPAGRPTMENKIAAPLVHPNGRCHAVTRGGQPCKNKPLPGETVCRMHRAVPV